MLETVPHLLRRIALLAVLAVGTLGMVAVPAAAQSNPIHVVQPGDTLFGIARANGLTVVQLKAYNGLTSDAISVGQRLAIAPQDGVPPRPMQSADRPGTPPGTVGPSEETDTDDRFLDAETMDPMEPDPVVAPPDKIPAGPPPPPPPPATVSRVRIGAGMSGQVILAPTRASTSEVHVVQAGETLFAIAQRYGLTVAAIRLMNGLEGDALSIGQELVVSGGAQPMPAPPPVPGGPYDVTRSTVPDDQVHVVRKGETLYAVAARYGTTVGALLALNTLTTAPLPAGTVVVLPDSAAQYYRKPAPPPKPDEVGLALVYPDSYEGRETISGEMYDPMALTASHRTLPFGTVLHVTMPATGRSTLVRVNDRGPVSEGFLIELSEAAAEAIGQNPGAAERVEVRIAR